MKILSSKKAALIALAAAAVWLFVMLPVAYAPSGFISHDEVLGIKPGEWLLSIATVAL